MKFFYYYKFVKIFNLLERNYASCRLQSKDKVPPTELSLTLLERENPNRIQDLLWAEMGLGLYLVENFSFKQKAS